MSDPATPTPTDPREEAISNIRARANPLQLQADLDEANALSARLDAEVRDIAHRLSESRVEVHEARATNSKLAAENAELRMEIVAVLDQLPSAIRVHEGSAAENICASLAVSVAALRAELEAEQAKRKDTAKDFETAFRLVRQDNDRLSAELETARKERDEVKSYGIEKLGERDAARDELARISLQLHQACAILQGNEVPESAVKESGLGTWVLIEQRHTAKQRDTALAAKDAAEKRAAELIPFTADEAKSLIDCLYNSMSPAMKLIIPTGWNIIINKLEQIRIAALTPAPTQEPPAGGVTISNDIERPIEVAGENDGGQKSQPSDVTISNPAVGKLAHPADTVSETAPVDRGEKSELEVQILPAGLLPFNLSDALAGKPVVTRKGKPVTKITEHGYSIFGDLGGIEHAWHKDGVYSRACESAWDLFMLPTEGSGATKRTDPMYQRLESAAKAMGEASQRGEVHEHNWVVSYTGKTRMCFQCWKFESITPEQQS